MSYRKFKTVDASDMASNNLIVNEQNLIKLFDFNVVLDDESKPLSPEDSEQTFTSSEFNFTRSLRTDNIFLTDDFNWGLTVPIPILDSTSNYSIFYIFPKTQTKGIFYNYACNLSAAVTPGENGGGSSSIVIPITDGGITYNVSFTSAPFTIYDSILGLTDTGIRFTADSDRFRNNAITLTPVRLYNGYIAIKVLLEWSVGTIGGDSLQYNWEISFNRPVSTYPLKFILELNKAEKRKDLAMIVNKPIYKLIFVVVTGGESILSSQGLVDFLKHFIKLDVNTNYIDPVKTASCFLGPIVNIGCFQTDVNTGFISGGDSLISAINAVNEGTYPSGFGEGWFINSDSGIATSSVSTESLELWYNLYKSHIKQVLDLYPNQYQIDIYEIFKSNETPLSSPHWWVDEQPFKDDRLIIRRFNESFVETFTYGQCLYDGNLYDSFVKKNSLGLNVIDCDLSAVVIDEVVPDRVKGSQIYATSFNTAGIGTWWDTMQVIIGESAWIVNSTDLTPANALMIYPIIGFGHLFIDTINWSLWVKATDEGYKHLTHPTYASMLNGAYGAGFEQAINLTDTETFVLKFTYDGYDVTYDYYFHLVGRDNPNLQNRKPEYYNNYVNQTGTLPIGIAG